MSLNDQPSASPHPHAGIPIPAPSGGFNASPVMPQAMPTNQDLELLRFAQQHHQQHQARQLFAQQHQQRQQDLYDLQQLEAKQRQQESNLLPPGPQNPNLQPIDLSRNLAFPEPNFPSPHVHHQLPQQPHGLPSNLTGPSQMPLLPPQNLHQDRQQDIPLDFPGRMHAYDPMAGGPGLGPQQQQVPPPFMDQVNYPEPPLFNIPPEERDAVMNQAMYKIVEAERNEERRRRRMFKIASMVNPIGQIGCLQQ